MLEKHCVYGSFCRSRGKPKMENLKHCVYGCVHTESYALCLLMFLSIWKSCKSVVFIDVSVVPEASSKWESVRSIVFMDAFVGIMFIDVSLDLEILQKRSVYSSFCCCRGKLKMGIRKKHCVCGCFCRSSRKLNMEFLQKHCAL